MKKILCLLLSVALMASVCAGALAETGYLVVQTVLAEILGEGVVLDIDETPVEHAAVMMVSPADETIFLWGYDSSGDLKVTVWDTDAATCMTLFALCCGVYDAIEGRMDEGYSLALILESVDGEETSFVTIDNATKAQEAVEVILEALGIDSLDELLGGEE